MIGTMWKARALVLATSLAGAAVLLAMAPLPVSNAALGSEWSCSKRAFVLTTCRQASIHNATRHENPKNPPA